MLTIVQDILGIQLVMMVMGIMMMDTAHHFGILDIISILGKIMGILETLDSFD